MELNILNQIIVVKKIEPNNYNDAIRILLLGSFYYNYFIIINNLKSIIQINLSKYV